MNRIRVAAAVRLALFTGRGVVTEQTHDSDTSRYGGKFGVEAVAKASGGIVVDTMSRSSIGGRYRDGVSWQPGRACG